MAPTACQSNDEVLPGVRVSKFRNLQFYVVDIGTYEKSCHCRVT